MKNIILIVISLLISLNLSAKDINPDIKPEPLNTSGFTFPNYTLRTLSNGLKVYIIEDNEQPTIALRLMIFGGSSVEGTKSGVAELATSMLTKGTKNKSAIQLAQQMDGIGATLTSNTSPDFYTIYAEGLKKHTNIILENMSDILLNPNFPADEFIKLQQQTIAGLQYEKSNSGSLAQALSKIAVYGKDHPYSSRKTESSINSITTNDLIEFHTK